jgi:hypothetical protein
MGARMQRSVLAIVMLTALSVGAATRADEPQPQGAAQTPDNSVQTPSPGAVPTPSPGAVPTPPPGAVPTPLPLPNSTETPSGQGAVETPPKSAVQSVAPEDAEAVLGQRVTDQEGTDIGRLVDVLVDANGQPQAAVIDFGGFMGVGNRKIAVHWGALRFSPGDEKHKVVLEMTPDQIKAAPEFLNPNKAAPVVTPANTAPTSP